MNDEESQRIMKVMVGAYPALQRTDDSSKVWRDHLRKREFGATWRAVHAVVEHEQRWPSWARFAEYIAAEERKARTAVPFDDEHLLDIRPSCPLCGTHDEVMGFATPLGGRWKYHCGLCNTVFNSDEGEWEEAAERRQKMQSHLAQAAAMAGRAEPTETPRRDLPQSIGDSLASARSTLKRESVTAPITPPDSVVGSEP